MMIRFLRKIYELSIIIDLDRYSSRSSSNVAQIVMRELVMGKSILLSTAKNNNEKTDSSKSVIFIKVDLDKFLELCQTEYFRNAYYEDFIGGSFISVDEIFSHYRIQTIILDL